ncbi:hypothetical protein [uncultured Bacteroides sp.]|uniref:hypothetical protein n=1 Tax=uncultured Bacteroides sp. TaxID=162156 RepID=UPI002AAA953A|nr:hypothetical protein [uncultured Bacteroides sp.]
MELKEFISETIQQIALGVKDAMDKCEELDIIVNPNITVGANGDYYIPKTGSTNMQRRVQLIDMDIAITVSESSEQNAGGGANIKILNVGGGIKEGKSTSNENRVKFSIPVCLPISNVDIKPRNLGGII